MFLERELFRTRSRSAVLVVVCRFERIAVILTDTGVVQYAPPSALHEIATEAKALLATRGGADVTRAFELVFGRLKALLAPGGFTGAPLQENEIADDVLTGRDA
jgi:uncharacterized membrane protein